MYTIGRPRANESISQIGKIMGHVRILLIPLLIACNGCVPSLVQTHTNNAYLQALSDVGARDEGRQSDDTIVQCEDYTTGDLESASDAETIAIQEVRVIDPQAVRQLNISVVRGWLCLRMSR